MKGLTDPMVGLLMGQTAENVAHRFGITREKMDAFAVHSHESVIKAQDAGILAAGGGEVEALYDAKGNTYIARRRRAARRLAAEPREAQALLRPQVRQRHARQQLADHRRRGLADPRFRRTGHRGTILKPLGRIVDSHWAGLDPATMGLGPVHAATPILQRNNLALKDIDYWEINEAFAAQVLGCLAAWEDEKYCREELGLDGPLGSIDEDRLNVDGGAIALGHPVGASGARIVLHLLKILKRNNAKRGMASICIGGGLGGAMLVEAL